MILGTTTDGTNLAIDLDHLIGSHLGIVANAGGGKSGFIRRLLEQTYGHIQHIVLDIEDEFYTLREQHAYVIAGGDGADAPATPANAAGLALGALEHGFSLICQLNDLGAAGASEFVDAFLAAMISAPRELWRPVLIVIDETQRFNPDSIRMLTERGRKRGFTAVLASQRLPKIDANIRGDLNNWIMGRVGQSLDRGIMADQLGFPKSDKRLTGIETRHFWAIGPALSPEPVLFRAGDAVTTMVKPGQAKVATPPAPEAMRAILAGLTVPEPTLVPSDPAAAYAAGSEAGAMIVERDRRIAALETQLAKLKEREQRVYDSGRTAGIGIGLVRARQALAALRIPEMSKGSEVNERVDDLGSVQDARKMSTDGPPLGAGKAKLRTPTVKDGVTAGETAPLNAAARKMLDMLEQIAPARVTWTSLATMIGNKARGGNFNAARKAMRESGLIVEDGDTVRSASEPIGGMSRPDALALWQSVLTNPAPRMIAALDSADGLTRAALGDALGIVPRGGNYNNGVAQLVRNGVAFDRGGALHLAEPLPGESA